ncbi:MAG: hypothetical protein CVV27_02865 [Candidatus Melainabacteria bacterium HGW-Melainabacteria-1]|nr:MAG: hypothetical protein CVV27_02865 [Candidatus Melainabacteria bacterium HGW-Melainabacteria-1]
MAVACTPRIMLWPLGDEASAGASAEPVNLANPASGFCRQNNGRLVIRRNQLGAEAGFCVFTDRSFCEEWAYYRDQCKPGDNPDFE